MIGNYLSDKLKVSNLILNKLNLRLLSLAILFIAFALMAYLWRDLNKTEKSLASKLIDKTNYSAITLLEDYFLEVKSDIQIIRTHLEKDILRIHNENDIINYAFPILHESTTLQYMGSYDEAGNEISIFVRDSAAVLIQSDTVSKRNFHNTWEYQNDEWVETKSVEIEEYIEPKNRPYFAEPMLNGFEGIFWEKPRVFTTNRSGIAVSSTYRDSLGNKMLFALGLLVDDITKFLKNIDVSDHGNVFVLTEEGYFLGLPRNIEFEKNKIYHIDSLDHSIQSGYRQWKENPTDQEFKIAIGGYGTWYSFAKVRIDGNYEVTVGVELPEMDILSQVKRTKRVILFTFICLLIITAFAVYSYGLARRANQQLLEKNRMINSQKNLIEEKNKNISDSIEYAKRLQFALLPTEEKLRDRFRKGFVVYLPKDVVSGDFYWTAKNKNLTYLASADCTGHGVPGAIVSVVCIKALNQSINLEGLKSPSDILNRTRELVIEEFSKTDIEVNDGMDIALVRFDDQKKGEVEFSGAHHSFYYIKKNTSTVEEIKGDRQPIGNYKLQKEFTNHQLNLEDGDRIYLTSDGLIDQFGGTTGKKLKSKGFKSLLLAVQQYEIADQEKHVKQFFYDWKGDFEQIDDVCMFGLEV